jgi:hypothetical protein
MLIQISLSLIWNFFYLFKIKKKVLQPIEGSNILLTGICKIKFELYLLVNDMTYENFI